MTVRIATATTNGETHNAELLRQALISSEPELERPDVSLEIICGLLLPGAEIDLVVLFHDRRRRDLQFKTSEGYPVHSFVLAMEVKHHSPDHIRFQGPALEVQYDGGWHNASDQSDRQTYALKSFQRATHTGHDIRDSTFVQRAVWLARAPRGAFKVFPPPSSVPVHFAQISWRQLIDRLEQKSNQIRALLDNDHPKYHSLATLKDLLTYRVEPTRLDRRRINAITHARFDAEKSAYIGRLGEGLLLLRGRGGTGKTFSLLQIALHLAKQGKRTVLLTFNHGLISDVSRMLKIIADEHGEIRPMPVIQTRYAFVQQLFECTFGYDEERQLRQETADLTQRENLRQDRLLKHGSSIEPGYDFILIDEAQDWSEAQRDLIFKLVGADKVVVADGVDQFVNEARCNWDQPSIRINRRHRLRESRRTKGATCQTVAEIAREVGIADWDLEPDSDVFGGRITVLVEPNGVQALARGLALLGQDEDGQPDLRPVDNLVCLPSSKMARGLNFSALFDRQIDNERRHSWRGFDEECRRNYPLEQSQLRAVQYASCRGMEGWTTLCLGLDLFYDFHLRNPRIDKEQIEAQLQADIGFLTTPEMLENAIKVEERKCASNWLMIPLTRSIDHLVIHLADSRSTLGAILSRVATRLPGAITWLDEGIHQDRTHRGRH